jgi:hypothetical protein
MIKMGIWENLFCVSLFPRVSALFDGSSRALAFFAENDGHDLKVRSSDVCSRKAVLIFEKKGWMGGFFARCKGCIGQKEKAMSHNHSQPDPPDEKVFFVIDSSGKSIPVSVQEVRNSIDLLAAVWRCYPWELTKELASVGLAVRTCPTRMSVDTGHSNDRPDYPVLVS